MQRRRDIRLHNDYEEMIRLGARADWFDFVTEGTPPTRYLLTFRCRGLMRVEDRIVISDFHQCRMLLGAHYPSHPPDVTWLTPIFHPNIRGEAVCHSSHWAASWSLADFVAELADMIRLAKHNVNSPLDRVAADWVRRNLEKLPLDPRSLRGPSVTIRVSPKVM
ncbi:MAG: hypothetical protein D6795_01540 [Deltaproteobacteria bacterium]|nr:MAG: hypothetical protein D6795_01540 [Deltaproteobacteria bacterium]